ncbi:hypothetical protein NVP1102O_12 [Vibrio phage 1.102.O._10N.261.45.E3]|uniref:TMhelix containing protein n=9 Tax=Autolykiviridae TaxID=2184034 RepID=A0A2I7R1W5_9VIRU|nr:hypothetical protein KMD64_gp11 [Vibrio phage 1.044.O._10N.261.51.B8]AUR83894.1 hypothetical protein NVP1043O_11 [Vibrio phage 1.043.O._10N.261.52.C7]AUR84099.1 hypothetical protein NVP1048O_12 [Vibrio phage 1.048.O._10N.286.46.A10]AUR84506.1 hypothetical protein NVP1057O_11 [Vibrio phage 1.057.O._10N.261.46.B12]AUR87136.1 hypothetical protein NVP1095O_12 [Vibrio phage 1.095.O._10N.286.46.E10]AUR87647.1 hypothetical protein NVP1102O_12 [Vibrio phage 1.102.O._10N.261.45.E3]AUR88012.1 hypoth
MPKKYMPYLINAAVAGATAYLVTKATADNKTVVWYNPASWF